LLRRADEMAATPTRGAVCFPRRVAELLRTGLDATSWRAELAIRFGVILRKVWGSSRTWTGARA
jgi:hypothetical protein